MNITRENIGELNEIIKIKLEEKDYAENVDKALKETRKKANLPGFRPGHVPMGYIKKAYGRSIKADEVNKKLSDSLFNFLKDEKLRYLGEPLPYELESDKNIDFENDKDFEFAFEIGLSPEVDIDLNKRTKINFYKVNAEEKYIDSTIEDNQKRLANEEEVEKIEEDDDMLRADFAQIDENKTLVENGNTAEDVLIAVNMIKDDSLKDQFKGLKAGDTLEFNPMKAFANETDVAAMLAIDKSNLEALNSDYKITVKKAIRYIPAELNEDFYKKLFGPETKITTVEDLKVEIKNKIEEDFAPESEARLFLDFRKKMLSKVDMTLPSEFLKRWIKMSSKDNQELDDETFNKEFPKFEEDLKWQIITASIFEKNELKVTDAEMHASAEELVIGDLKRYGIPMSSMNDELIHQFVHSMLEKKEDKERVQKSAEQKVLMSFVKETIKVEEKELSIDEFNDLNKDLEEK